MLRPTLLLGAVLLGALSSAACYIERPREHLPPAPGAEMGPAPSGGALEQVEAKLLGAHGLRCRFSIVATGPVPATLQGVLQAQRGNRVRIDADGLLQGKPARPHLLSDGAKSLGGSNEKQFADAAPPAVQEAVLRGFVRMGLLHNLATIAGGAEPDGADGSFARNVTNGDVKVSPTEPGRLDFTIVVEGKPRGQSTLWLEPQSGMPKRRHTTVHFDDGDLQVDETYPECVADAQLPADTFQVAQVPMEI